MQKFIEGPVQISTKMNNYNKLISPSQFLSGGSFNTEDLRQMWGNFWSANPLPNTTGMDDLTYEQSLDMYSKYQNRSLPLHSRYITAAARNARNDFIITYATPLFQTSELNFHVTNTEFNQIDYDELPEGGIANEPTSVKWGWTDTSRKKVQWQHFSVDLAKDPNYGAATFIANFAQLANNCLLSLYKSTYYSIVQTAYQNKIYDRTADIPFDISKLYLSEMEAFFAFAVDPATGFNLIRDELRERDRLDLVLLPEGGSRWVKEEGGTQRELRSRILNYNTAAEQFEAAVDQPGPMTYRSYRLGENWLDFMETRSFKVNSLDPRMENPLSTKLTLCQFYPPNTDCKPTDKPVSTDPTLNDIWIFYQTKEEGEDRRIPFADQLRYCGYWDPDDGVGEISQAVKNYIAQLNRQGASTHNAPWQFQIDGAASDVNKDIGDYENPSVAARAAIGTCTDLTRMTSVRDKFVGVLYDTVDRQYKQVDYIVSNHLDTLPNIWILKAVESLALKFHEKTGSRMDHGLEALYALLDNMSRAHITEDYIKGVIDANMPALLQGGDVPQPYTGNGIPEFVLNAYGSLDLPSDEVATRNGITYPNGFQSGPGLLTLRDQLLRVNSPYRVAALETNEALAFVEQLIAFLKQYIGDTDVISPDLAAPWFQFGKGIIDPRKSKNAAIATFIDAIWGRGTPVFMGIPKKAVARGVAVEVDQGPEFSQLRPDGTASFVGYLTGDSTNLTTVDLSKYDYVSNGRPVINDAIKALSVLSRTVAEEYKLRILLTPTSAEHRKALEAYFQCVIAQTNGGKETNVASRRVANGITEKFFSLLADGSKDASKAAEEFIVKINSGKSNDKAAKELTQTGSYQKGDDSLAASLDAFVQSMATKDVAYVGKVDANLGQRQKKARSDQGKLLSEKVTYFDGDYQGSPAPDRYLRTPFISSDKLVDFIRKTGFKWAVPGDATTLFTTPDADAARWNRTGVNPGTYGSSVLTSGEAHGRLSAALDVLSLGAGFGGQSRDAIAQFRYHTDSDAKAEAQYALRQYYPGPVEARIQFYDKIENEFHKVLFLALIQAKNTLQTHLKLSEVGAQLINVLLFRPFIEFFACSVVVMKAGEESGAVPVSRFETFISKEDRGYFHIGCSYYSGFIRLNPGNFRLIPYCMPDRFVGGKKTDFMTRSDQWVPHNPVKPSIVALPTPIAERTYASPLHMTNGQSIARPDIDYPTYTGKYSSAGFYECRFSSDNTSHVDECHMDRHKYKDVTHASHVAHRGWRAFKDPSTGHLKEFEGTGPGCTRSMNMPGAQYVWNGKAALFEKDHATMYTRARAM
jgi:hypothetical protein